MKTIQEFAKEIDRFSKTLARLVKRPSANVEDVLVIAEKAVQDCKSVDFGALQSALGLEHASLTRNWNDSLAKRREDLEKAARAAGIPFKRIGSVDQFDLLKLEYKREKVLIYIGSEKFKELAVAEGAKLSDDLRAELQKLRRQDFSRESFIHTLKLALAWAREAGKAREGRAKVRDLFPFFVVALQISSSDFVRRPSKNSFRDYSMADFAFELARFGEDGWECGNQRIGSQGPNMASHKEALMLPRKPGSSGAVDQVLSLWVEG